MSFSIDVSRWSDQAKQLLRATGRDAADVLKQEGRLFLQDCVRLTPPTSKRPFNESYNVQRRAGEKAIQKDIQKIFADPQALDVVKNNPKLSNQLRDYANRGALEKATTLLRRLGVKAPIVLTAEASVHRSSRGAGGRTLKGRQQMVLRGSSITRLIKQQQRKVGLEKSGWLAAAKGLGVSLPNWITRHNGAAGIWQDDTKSDNPSIIMGNLVGYAQAHGLRLQVIKRAFDRRVDSLKKRLEHIVQKNFKNH